MAAKNKSAPSQEKIMAEKKPLGRPTDYSQELIDNICERLSNGESLRAICRDDDMPNKATVFRWLASNSVFSDQYMRAREAQADEMFDDMLAIADDGLNDTYKDEDGRVRTDHDVIARSRLRVDARKWMLSKMVPKKYGDKLAIGGADDLPPITSSLDVSSLSTEALTEIMAARDANKQQ